MDRSNSIAKKTDGDENLEHENDDVKEESIERIFESKEVPPWQKQLTFRAFFVSFVLSILFTFIVMKLNLTTGIIPSLNVSAGLLGFFFVKTWTKFLEKSGILKQPFTRQENTVIQTCVVASSGIAFSGGFGSYLFGMSEVVAKQSTEAHNSLNIKNPSLSWMIGFLFVVSFLGLFSVVPLRKIMIIDFKLIYPSGTATAHLINSFHTPQGAKLAKKQVRTLGKFFSFSFLWGFFQWFFTAGDDCGFVNFPTFGLKAYENNQVCIRKKIVQCTSDHVIFLTFFTLCVDRKKTHRFYFDFSATYVGVGMICPYLINISLLVGAILSWGVMWPLIQQKKGLHSYRHDLGDGLYNFFKVLGRTIFGLYHQLVTKTRNSYSRLVTSPLLQLPLYHMMINVGLTFSQGPNPNMGRGRRLRHHRNHLAATLPHIFRPSNGTTSSSYTYSRPIFGLRNATVVDSPTGLGFHVWEISYICDRRVGGANHGGVLRGLAACGVMMNIVSTASDLTQDFKTGYMTLAFASPWSMFVSKSSGRRWVALSRHACFGFSTRHFTIWVSPAHSTLRHTHLSIGTWRSWVSKGFRLCHSIVLHFVTSSLSRLLSSTALGMPWGENGRNSFLFQWRWRFHFISERISRSICALGA
ncbi:hypothetical protein DH2020_013709 [Rehmannia glutinosa]|uniref:Uncharacterized protein n=1 Tax=Rehmannia glutinosa TaxID=99300 RepID=A0ABR0X3P9_REHGL